MLIAILIVLTLMPVGIWFFWKHGPLQALAKQEQDILDTQDGMAKMRLDMEQMKAELAKARSLAITLDENQTTSRVEWKKLDKTVRAAQTELDEAASQITQFLDDTAALRTSDQGKKLATTEETLREYEGLLVVGGDPEGEVDELRDQLAQLAGPVGSALDEEMIVVSPGTVLRSQIEDIYQSAVKLKRTFRDKNGGLRVLLRGARGEVPSDTSSLEDALEEMTDKRRQERLADAARKIETAQKRFTDEIAKKKIDVERRIKDEQIALEQEVGEAKAAEIRQATELLIEERRQSAEAHARKMAKAKLAAQLDAEWSKVNTYIRGFTAKLTEQPRGAGSYQEPEPMPVSLSALRPALQAGDDGRALWTVMMALRQRRQVGGWPQYGRPQDVAFARQAKLYLIKYGDLLVERGLLRK
jgi:hypothetical protein